MFSPLILSFVVELYNHKAKGDPSVLNCTQTDTEDDHPILRREVEAAVQSLNKGKSAGVDNIPAELVQAGGEDVITALTTICHKIWQTGEWPTPWTESLISTLPKKGNLKQCQNCRTISIISAGFRTGRSTTEQIFNLRILCEEYLQHQQDLYHVFRLQEGLRQGLACSFVGNHEEVQHQHQLYPSHQNLYDKATSAVLFNSSTGDWFRTTVGVRQGCLLSSTFFNIFLERIEQMP